MPGRYRGSVYFDTSTGLRRIGSDTFRTSQAPTRHPVARGGATPYVSRGLRMKSCEMLSGPPGHSRADTDPFASLRCSCQGRLLDLVSLGKRTFAVDSDPPLRIQVERVFTRIPNQSPGPRRARQRWALTSVLVPGLCVPRISPSPGVETSRPHRTGRCHDVCDI